MHKHRFGILLLIFFYCTSIWNNVWASILRNIFESPNFHQMIVFLFCFWLKMVERTRFQNDFQKQKPRMQMNVYRLYGYYLALNNKSSADDETWHTQKNRSNKMLPLFLIQLFHFSRCTQFFNVMCCVLYFNGNSVWIWVVGKKSKLNRINWSIARQNMFAAFVLNWSCC